MRLVDLARQVQGILPIRFGGTGNARGYGSAVIVPATNREGATMPLGSIVAWWGGAGVRLATDTDVVLGVVVGYVGPYGALVEADVANGATAAVMTQGICRALAEADLTGGTYAFVSSSNDGQGYGDATRDVGAFGLWLQTADVSVRGPLTRIMLWGATDGSSGGGGGGTFGTPALTFDTTNGAGSTDEVIRRDAQIAVFDGTSPADVSPTAAATGSAGKAARRDHVHRMILKADVDCEFVSPSGGTQSRARRVPYDCTVIGWYIAANGTGSCVVDIWRSTLAGFPPVLGGSITASAKPTLSAARTASSTTLTGWTTSLAEGDWLVFEVDSVSGITEFIIALAVRRA